MCRIYINFCYTFNHSLQTGIFPDKLKIDKVTPLFKGNGNYELGNYRPISVWPCFSKILEKIIYNGLYKDLSNNGILYKNPFCFQKGHSTEHAIVQLLKIYAQICQKSNPLNIQWSHKKTWL